MTDPNSLSLAAKWALLRKLNPRRFSSYLVGEELAKEEKDKTITLNQHGEKFIEMEFALNRRQIVTSIMKEGGTGE